MNGAGNGGGGAIHPGVAPVVPTIMYPPPQMPQLPPDTPPHILKSFETLQTQIASMQDMLNSAAEATRSLQARTALAEAQCQTHWELLSRIHDLVVVFDMAGIIVFVSPMCEQILQVRAVCRLVAV